MPQTGYCTDVTCQKELTELYECHCCSWLVCLKHLLEHVEISKREKKEQFDSLRNELISISYTLELLVEKKAHEIECEKQLIDQSKIILDKSGHTMEEIQLISEEINRAIVSNRKEETIVKVESSLADLKSCLSRHEITAETSMSPDLFSSSSSNPILQQPQSPTYVSLRTRTNASTPKSNDRTTKITHVFSINTFDDENISPMKDEADAEKPTHENISKHKNLLPKCPLTFDGAFGLTKENHSLEICSIDTASRRNLVAHFTHKHKFKRICAHRLNHAIKNNQDPQTTKLFSENEDVIDHHRRISCPFSNNMINLIGCCPTQSRRIPCPSKHVVSEQLVLHLRKTHDLSLTMARKIAKHYKEKLSKTITNTMSH